jgi:hypothetical protein
MRRRVAFCRPTFLTRPRPAERTERCSAALPSLPKRLEGIAGVNPAPFLRFAFRGAPYVCLFCMKTESLGGPTAVASSERRGTSCEGSAGAATCEGPESSGFGCSWTAGGVTATCCCLGPRDQPGVGLAVVITDLELEGARDSGRGQCKGNLS